MKSTSPATRSYVLLAVMALPLGACVAPTVDSGDENVAEADDALSTWVADTQLSGQSSQSAPAITTYNNDAVMVYRGSSNNNLYTTKYDGYSWSSTTQIPGQSAKGTPALAQHGTKLHMAYNCGSSGWAICYSNYQTGGAWSAPVTLSYESNMPPALVSDPISNRLMIAYVGTGTYMMYAFNDGNWQNYNAFAQPGGLPVLSKPPALAVHNGRIHMVYESGGLLRHTSFNGSSWETSQTVPYKFERNNPALTSYAGTLYLFHRGYSDNNIWWSSSADGNSWTSDVSIPGALTQDSPAIATGGIFLTLVHRGPSNNQLWWSAQAFW